jgi:hypothetical protein
VSKCDLWITLDRESPKYRPGETVKGILHAEVHSDLKIDALVVSLGWRTHGKGNVDEEQADVAPLGPKHWSADERHELPFSFVMPAGPVSYHGHFLNVDWYVKANADVAWARDPKTESEILLLPAPAERVPGDGYRTSPHTTARPHVLGAAGGAPRRQDHRVFSLLFVLGAFGMAALMLRKNLSVPTLLVLSGFLGVSGLVAYRSWRNTLAKQKLGNIEVSVEPEHAGRGQPVQLTVVLRPAQSVSLASVRANLVGRERVVSGSGTNRTTHVHQLHHERFELSGERRLRANEELVLQETVTIPDEAEPTFHSADNHLVWEIEFHVDVKLWPDLKDDYEVFVHPS